MRDDEIRERKTVNSSPHRFVIFFAYLLFRRFVHGPDFSEPNIFVS